MMGDHHPRRMPVVNGWERCEKDEEWEDFVWKHQDCRYLLTLRPQERNPKHDSEWALMLEEPDTGEVRAILFVGYVFPLLAKAKTWREQHTSWPPRSTSLTTTV